MQNDISNCLREVYEAECGFVYAATGEKYTTMARRSARNLKRACPDFPIDLFTDQNIEDDVFDCIHLLKVTDCRPKMESLLRSRFHKTFFLDADTIPVADFSDVFDRLETYEFAAAFATQRNREYKKQNVAPKARAIPASFPEYNSGLIGIRKTPTTLRVLEQWEAGYKGVGKGMDQPFLRAALYKENPLIWALPPEFNLINLRYQQQWRAIDGPIRVLHVQELQRIELGDPNRAFYLDEVFGPELAKRLLKIISQDSYASSKESMRNAKALASPGFDFNSPGPTPSKQARDRLNTILRKLYSR